MNTLPFTRYSWMVSSPSKRVVTSAWSADGVGLVSESSGGGGGSSRGVVPAGRARSTDCPAADSDNARSKAVKSDRFMADAQCSTGWLEREFGFAFLGTRLEAARMVVVEDRVHDFLRIVGDL